ncbi:ethanolamine ammonia-lyase subunit EutC [Zhongshania marina]|uniref:Ethanolamine ammonia-lyase small subunit n=1 Tax=Zhongshania marina TaxID=2304603 RepID=A0ABX9W789_9GAMM|nr:ethanolamine ammonia-lyase subunit EutC [Zhongshania marina]
MKELNTQRDVWQVLREYTPARIAQGRVGVSLPTGANLLFQLDHARARDAVHCPFNATQFASDYRAKFSTEQAALILQSEAADRAQYLQRPDLGRRLADAQWHELRQTANNAQPFDIAIVVADGLSSAAVEHHALALLEFIVPAVHAQKLKLAPLCIATQARVAIGDDIGEALKARLVVVLIGERPGLSSPDSLGAYITYAPKRACSDAQRNCISNIRSGGLSYQQASDTAMYLIRSALKKSLSGVGLKDESVLLDGQTTKHIPFFKPSK